MVELPLAHPRDSLSIFLFLLRPAGLLLSPPTSLRSEKRILKRLRKNAKRKIKQLKERESHAEAGGGAGEQILSPFSSDEL